MLHLVVHNIGHHDLYLGDSAAGSALRRPAGSRLRRLGAVLDEATLTGATLAGDRRLELAAPCADPDGAPISHLYFPLLGAALDKVEAAMEKIEADAPSTGAGPAGGERRSSPPQRMELMLLTAGQADEANSPEGIAKALAAYASKRWAARGFGDRARVRHIHLPDAFSLDPGALYDRVQRPIENESQLLADQYASKWRKHLRVYLSASTGTAAMLAGLVTALHRWRPLILTVPNARQEPAIGKDGAPRPVHCRETAMHDIGASVRLEAHQLDDAATLATDELRRWVSEYREKRPVRAKDETGEQGFWFRKGQQEVLAALVTRGPDGALLAYRGVNLEVSLPTGSLCAERNAIGTALVAQPTLRRQDIQAVAIVGLDEAQDRLGPCGACQEWLRKVSEVNPGLQILTFNGPSMSTVYHQPLSPS